MPCILVSDIHLSEKPCYAYRFQLFDWLVEQCHKYNASHIFFLGDLTDGKDSFPAWFVHKCIDSISTITDAGIKFGWLFGNHDGLSVDTPFFKFIEKHSDNIRYYTEPTIDDTFYSKTIIWLPHSRDISAYQLDPADVACADYVFLHGTVAGCKAANGQVMQGIPVSTFKGWTPKIWCGDIHFPQKIGPAEYVGAPYRTNLGDTYQGRCVVIDDNSKTTDIHFPCVNMETVNLYGIEQLTKLSKFHKNDQVKVRLHITQAEVHDWESYKKSISTTCDEFGLEKMGVELIIDDKREGTKVIPQNIKKRSIAEIFDIYCNREHIDGHIKEVGEKLL